MKNLFKNKSFYFGLAATFAVALGLYIAFPSNNDVQTASEVTTQTQGTDSTGQPAANMNQPAVNAVTNPIAPKSEKTAPVTNTQPGSADDNVDPNGKNSKDQI